MLRQRHGVENKKSGILVTRKAAEACSLSRNLLIAHERAIHAGSAAIRKYVADGVIHRIIRIEIIAAMVALDIERLCRFADDHRFLRRLRRLHGCRWLRLRPGRNCSEILLQHRHHFRRLHIADYGNHYVRGHIILRVESSSVGRRYLADFRLPSHVRPMIRRSHKGSCGELFQHASNGR